jgi:hypothetical protein
VPPAALTKDPKEEVPPVLPVPALTPVPPAPVVTVIDSFKSSKY